MLDSLGRNPTAYLKPHDLWSMANTTVCGTLRAVHDLNMGEYAGTDIVHDIVQEKTNPFLLSSFQPFSELRSFLRHTTDPQSELETMRGWGICVSRVEEDHANRLVYLC